MINKKIENINLSETNFIPKIIKDYISNESTLKDFFWLVSKNRKF